VSQISPPIRIVLVCAVAFMAAYMLFLRPKDEVVPPAEPAPNVQTAEPAVSAPGQAAEAAQGAVAATNAHTDAVSGEAPAAATGTATATTPGAPGEAAAEKAPPADLAGVPAPVAKAIAEGKVVVLLFWHPKSADDRAVRNALRRVDGWSGRVYKQAAPIGSISKYGRITRGAEVEQSPTVVVVDPELRAETLVGFVDTPTIEQAIVDALRNSTGLFDDPYLAEINQLCAESNAQLYLPDPDTGREAAAGIATLRTKFGRFQREFATVKVPKRWRAFHRASVRDHAAAAAIYADLAGIFRPNVTPQRAVTTYAGLVPRYERVVKRYDRRMDAENVLSCGSHA
jgi:hypothetical protein